MVLQKLKAILRHKGYKLYTRPYELNIVGLRANSVVPNRFDDEIHVFYKVSSTKWNYHVFKATTDPGTYWLRNPMEPQGTAILAQGQYEGAYELGLHKGQYLALVQKKSVNVIRDYDRDALLDFGNGKITRGLYGINIHRANRVGTTISIDRNSAGCQVFANAENFAAFIKLCQNHKKLYGNSFSYTLIDFRAVRRETYRRITIGSLSILGVLAFGYFAWRKGWLRSISEEIDDSFSNLKTPQNNYETQTHPAPIT